MIRAAQGGLQLAISHAEPACLRVLPNFLNFFTSPLYLLQFNKAAFICRMHCPTCHNDLVEIPTVEGPQVDVCAARHGLWLDRGEATLFVKNYRALEIVREVVAKPISGPAASCPKCGRLLDQAALTATTLFACRACDGWWLPQGSLTQLKGTIHGCDAPICGDEEDFYRRAGKRSSASHTNRVLCPAQLRHGLRAEQVWFWTIFLSIALLFSGLFLMAGIRNSFLSGPWAWPTDTGWMFLAVGVLAGMGLSGYGFMVNNRKRLIESIPTSSIRSLAIGLVEVRGRVQPERTPLRAPFSGIPCAFFSYTVERRTSGKDTSWKMIATGMSQEPFYVQDQTGRVLVVPFDAQLILPDNKTTRSNWSGTLPEETILGLLKLGIAVEGWLGEKTIRCSETFLLPDQHVYVMGTAQEHKGAIDDAENAARLYIGSGRGNAFIISDRSEKELLSSMQWQIWASMGGGPALALVCLLLLFRLYATVH
jgi:Zn-finger nucleic acid-binding protein